MIRKSNLLLLVALCLLLSACNTEGMNVGVPTVTTGATGRVTSALLDTQTSSVIVIEGLKDSYKPGETASFDVAFVNRYTGTYTVDYKVRLMYQDQNQPRDLAYGTSGTIVIYEAQTQRIPQQIAMPTDLAAGSYNVNVFLAKVTKSGGDIATDINLNQPISVAP